MAHTAREIVHTLETAIVPPEHMRTPVGGGITRPTRTVLDGIPAIVKRSIGGSPVEHEYLAYALSETMPGLVIVPPTVLRTVSGRTVSVQEWRTDAHRMPHDARGMLRSDIVGAAVFDYIIDNTDRHPGNALETDTGHRVVCIDHGFAFNSSGAFSVFLDAVAGARVPAYIRDHMGRYLAAHVGFAATARRVGYPRAADDVCARVSEVIGWRTFPDPRRRW